MVDRVDRPRESCTWDLFVLVLLQEKTGGRCPCGGKTGGTFFPGTVHRINSTEVTGEGDKHAAISCALTLYKRVLLIHLLADRRVATGTKSVEETSC